MRTWKPSELSWTPENELMTKTVAFRNFYNYLLDFWKQGNISEYVDELHDWELLLEVTAELQGRVISPAKFVRTIVNPRTGYLPKPSYVICDRSMKIFADERKKIEEAEFRIFANCLKDLSSCAKGLDPQWYEGDGVTDEMMMANALLDERHRRKQNKDLDRTLEEYIVSESLGINGLLCDEQMFVRAAMSYYLRRSIVRKHTGLGVFVQVFEPVAREVYLALTNTADLDFDTLAARLSKKFKSDGGEHAKS